MKTEITNQTDFCKELMDRLHNSVSIHETKRTSDRSTNHSYVSACRTYASDSLYTASGYSKTEIQADIKLLRRELMELSKMFN